MGMGYCNMDWIDPTKDRNQLRAVVNMIMNLRVPQDVGEFLE
jgi:hypothetical protein